MNSNYDCVVIGAGPAGSSTAALLAESGLSTLLVEREKMPRFHIGESLMPETYWPLQRLGVLPKLKASSFPKKVGVQFVTESGKETRPFLFLEHNSHECSQTWHVERSDFDQLLFENAADKGAECVDQARVQDIGFRENGRHQVRIKTGGQDHGVETRVIVDATGQQTFLAGKLGLKRVNEDLKKAAIWGYFKGAKRYQHGDVELTVILHTRDKRCWFWYIPLSRDMVSVGVVSDHEYLLKQDLSPEEMFTAQLDDCPSVKSRLETAQRQGDLLVAKEFSYWTTRHAGDGWVLVGDALGFIDPIYSSGVFLALKSGEMAADRIIEGFRKNDLSAGQLGKWTDEFKDGVTLIRKLVRAFYTENFSFAQFVKAYPQHQRNLTDILIGRVFDEQVGDIFKDMDPWIERAN